MAATPSTMLELGTRMPQFSLPDVDGKTVSSADLTGSPGTLVMFICNHCPFVIHVRDELVKLVKQYQAKGIKVVAISANDVTTHPDDGPSRMGEIARECGFTFPYLYDESQETAKAFHAACTPDFFLFDGDGKLFYRGQMDDSRPGNDLPVDGKDLRAAIDELLSANPAPRQQKPSMGCNIKWREGNEPAYFVV
ncbi:MAG: thioredoxin family protein [Spirochaetaceae bacterium]|nr:MAG: thioredoxin family protein [Spirochaetaceae bacterium]